MGTREYHWELRLLRLRWSRRRSRTFTPAPTKKYRYRLRNTVITFLIFFWLFKALASPWSSFKRHIFLYYDFGARHFICWLFYLLAFWKLAFLIYWLFIILIQCCCTRDQPKRQTEQWNTSPTSIPRHTNIRTHRQSVINQRLVTITAVCWIGIQIGPITVATK